MLINYRSAARISGWETGRCYANAFERLGHEVDIYTRQYESEQWQISHDDRRRILSSSYDLVLCCEMNDPLGQDFEAADVKTERRAVCHYDTSYYTTQALTNIASYKPDHVFFANASFRTYPFKNSSWLPYAADPRFFRSIDTEKTIDVGLVGSDRPERRRLIEFLFNNSINAKLISDVFQEDYIDALASCRIVINENPPQGAGLLNMRTFEAPAAGAVLLSSDPECSSVLVNGIEGHVYSNVGDALEICKYLLSNPVDCISMSKRGQERIKDDHMYDNRVQDILDVLF